MGPEYWKPGSPTALKKCSERVSNDCDPAETDSCCAVIACKYCLEWDSYSGGIVTSTTPAEHIGTGWSGVIAGAVWFGFWEKDSETGVCEFVVWLDEVEIYRKSCEDGQSCRDSSDSAGAIIDYEEGTLTWTKVLSRPLEYVQDEETNCTDHFCDDCECSCETLCVLITEPDGTQVRGSIDDISYPCDPPVWSGIVGEYELQIALGRDAEGRCILSATVNGDEQDSVLAPGCDGMAATITLPDYTEIAVRCKECECEDDTFVDLPNCLCSPMGMTLNATMTGSASGACSFSGPLTMQDDEVLPTWDSEIFTLPTTPSVNAFIRISCVSRDLVFPANGFTDEDLTEVNSSFWYLISVINADTSTPAAEAFPFNYRDPDTLNGWVGRCRDGFFAVAYFLNTLCGGVGDGLVSIVITE